MTANNGCMEENDEVYSFISVEFYKIVQEEGNMGQNEK